MCAPSPNANISIPTTIRSCWSSAIPPIRSPAKCSGFDLQRSKQIGIAMRVTAYQRWMKEQEIPVHGGYGVQDAREAARKPWKLTGTPGAFIDLIGMEGF